MATQAGSLQYRPDIAIKIDFDGGWWDQIQRGVRGKQAFLSRREQQNHYGGRQ
jgi:uncharacterized protein (AIM24 family)